MEFYFLHAYRLVFEMIVLILHNLACLNRRHSVACWSGYVRTSQETNLLSEIKVIIFWAHKISLLLSTETM